MGILFQTDSKAFCEEFHREVTRLRTEHNGELDGKRRELARVQRRIKRVVDLLMGDDAPVRSLKQELVALEARQDALQIELEATPKVLPMVHPSLIELYREQVEKQKSCVTRFTIQR